jgi:hypothetical protein
MMLFMVKYCFIIITPNLYISIILAAYASHNKEKLVTHVLVEILARAIPFQVKAILSGHVSSKEENLRQLRDGECVVR